VVIGGEGNGQAFDTVEELNPVTNLWTEAASLNHARHGTQAIVSGDGIFVAAGSPRQGGGNQHNLEAFNSRVPVGVPNTVGVLEFEEDELVIPSSREQEFNLLHVGGNQGVMVTGIELSGDSADRFLLNETVDSSVLVTVGGSKTISIQALKQAVTSETASLVITYSDGETLSIPVRFDENAEVIITPIILFLLDDESTTGK